MVERTFLDANDLRMMALDSFHLECTQHLLVCEVNRLCDELERLSARITNLEQNRIDKAPGFDSIRNNKEEIRNA